MDHRYKKFLVLVESGSFSAAAKKLHVSQPAITIAIASLERGLGKKLLVRKTHTIELTPEGEIVLKTAKKLSTEVEKMKTQLIEISTDQIQHVGFIDSIAHLLYTSSKETTLLGNVEAMVDNSVRILNDLTTKQIDFGFITGQPGPITDDITVDKLRDEQFVFVTSPAKAPKKPVTKISNWLAFNQASTTYQHFMNQFVQYGLSVTPVFYSTSMELLRDMAIAGNGVALLPRHFVADAIQKHTLAVVKTKPLHRPIWIVSRKADSTPLLIEPLTKQVNALLARN